MQPMRRTKRALAIMALTLASCSTTVVPATTPTRNTVTLRLYATTPMLPLLQDLTTHYSRANPTFSFDTVTGNFEVMFGRLMAGETDFLLTNHLPENLDKNPVMAWPVGQDGIAVIAHPDNPVDGLTAEQLRGIYLGHIGNWREVGGNDTSIVVVSREDGAGTRAEFEQLVMGARQTTQSAQIAPSSAAMVNTVARTQTALGYVSMGYLDESVRALAIDDVLPTPDNVYDNLYPLRSTIYIIGLEEPDGDYRNFVSWIQSQEGQTVVGQRYAPLLRP